MTENTEIIAERWLYKVAANGLYRWRMDRCGHKHRTVFGYVGHTEVHSAWTECVSKGKGKAQTTPEQQAIKEVANLYKKALKRDYYETPAEAEVGGRNYLPMLAEKWSETSWAKWVKRVKAPSQGIGVWYQHKFDGYCAIITADKIQSREGLDITICGRHILKALEPFFAKHPDAVLHGELYNHSHPDFDKFGGLLRRFNKLTEEHFAVLADVAQFHIYDYPGGNEELVFGERWARLNRHMAETGVVLGSTIQLAHTIPITSEEELVEAMARSLRGKYEGGIGRLDLPYEKGKRSWSVIKIKEFDDDEFECLAVHEGTGNYAGYAKSATCRMKDGRTFDASIAGERDQALADLLYEEVSLVTVRYFGFTNGGKGLPRFGVVTKWFHRERLV